MNWQRAIALTGWAHCQSQVAFFMFHDHFVTLLLHHFDMTHLCRWRTWYIITFQIRVCGFGFYNFQRDGFGFELFWEDGFEIEV